MQLVTEEQLKEWTGYTRRADLQTFLNARGIQYHLGKGNCICTTLSAIERSLGIYNNSTVESSKYVM